MRLRHYPLVSLFMIALTCSVQPAAAKSSKWTDEKGGTFKGEPMEVIGPFVAFRRSMTSGQTVPLRALSPEDCARVFNEVSARTPRASDWSQAAGVMTKPLIGKVMRVEGDKLVPADLTGRPEPQILVLIYGASSEGESWALFHNFGPTYKRIQRIWPGVFEAVFYGLRHDANGHRGIATTTQMPWLVTDFDAQSSISSLTRFAPKEERAMVAVTREGVPLLAMTIREVTDIVQFVDVLTEYLRAIDPENPRAWRDRHHYARITRPLALADSADGPMLVGNPLREDVLRQLGLHRVLADLDVDAEGRVTRAVIDPAGNLPQELVGPLANALEKGAIVAPAVDHGRSVPGKLRFDLKVPDRPERDLADRLWMTPGATENILPNRWLLLKPIPVPESSFTSLHHVDETGTVVLTEMKASTGQVSYTRQRSAFHTNWFDEAGAASIRPIEGETQEIDGNTLKWTAAEFKKGVVEMQSGANRDYCIGYAWTEFEVAKDSRAWLGLGSDDGVKVWLNGELAIDKWTVRPSHLDDDIVPVQLRAGKNQVLVKIQNMRDAWNFIARLRVVE